MADKYPMTPAGHATMKAQLWKLKNVDRIANSRAIEVARGHGDLSENADYSAAKEEQGLIEARIRELEAKLTLAEVIDPTKLSGSRVKFGATVTIDGSPFDNASSVSADEFDPNETNNTDKDAGLQLFADAEQWKRFKLLEID